MKTAIKYICNANPFYLYLKKHFCPVCKKNVELRYNSKIINSNSPEAKNYDFSVGDTYFVGNVEFRTRFFYCCNCNREISFKEMKQYEKQQSQK